LYLRSFFIYNLTNSEDIDKLINKGIIKLSDDDANAIANAIENNFTNLYNYTNFKDAKTLIISSLVKKKIEFVKKIDINKNGFRQNRCYY